MISDKLGLHVILSCLYSRPASWASLLVCVSDVYFSCLNLLSVPLEMIDWKVEILVSNMTHYMLNGTLNSITLSLTYNFICRLYGMLTVDLDLWPFNCVIAWYVVLSDFFIATEFDYDISYNLASGFIRSGDLDLWPLDLKIVPFLSFPNCNLHTKL